jgi:tol-pal system protein YbgF
VLTLFRPDPWTPAAGHPTRAAAAPGAQAGVPRLRVATGFATVLWLALASSAHAGLFDDEEARKAIVDLRTRIVQVEEANKARIAELLTQNASQAAAQTAAQTAALASVLAAQAPLLEQISALRRSLLDLNNQLESLRGDVAKLRGSDEQIVRDVTELQRRQRDVGQTLDDRIRRLEPVKATIDGRDFMVDQEEKRGFEDAIAPIRNGEFDKAATGLASFQRRYPASAYSNQVRFWLGNALYGKRDYKDAVSAFRLFVTGAPDHPRAPEALLALANSQAEMKDPRAARRTIEELIKSYPQSEAAVAGKDRLASLK